MLYKKTGRNVIAYYSGWLQKQTLESGISDLDQNSFMTTIHNLDKAKGLDLILHTPGGNIAATEAIVCYLKNIFKNNIRVIVPHLAMSAGTMIACSSKEIIMGKHSSLGPTDPQFGNLSASAILEEFETAKKEVANDPKTIPLWQMIISKYNPTFLGECDKACRWAEKIVESWLEDNMFYGEKDANQKSKTIAGLLGDHKKSKNHSKHFSKDELSAMGLKIYSLESDTELQDLVLTVHHAFMHTFAKSTAIKIVENHIGIKIVSANRTSTMQKV
ncbi:MAG: ATP-dependent Clp protease proteolytic subunit [Endomicrobium sp.]|nr:ATP-dependent Clp protease proteolytic subunit [Endomicrobium sp.]